MVEGNSSSLPIKVRFGDVVRNVKVDVLPADSGLERYIAGEHMETDNLHIYSWGAIGDGYLGPAFHRKFVKGQVLYGSRRTYLRKVAVAEFDGVCANTTLVLEPKDSRLLPELLPFIMQTESFTDFSVKNSKGSVNPYINWSDLEHYEFPLTPLDEQRRIAEILWAVDKSIEGYKIVQKACLHYTESLIEKLLTEIINNEEISKTHLDEVLRRSPESGYSASPANKDTGIYVLALSALSKHGYIPGFYKPVEMSALVEKTRIKSGDFLISRSNTIDLVGFVGIFNEQRADVSFPDTMMRLDINENIVLKTFLETYLLSITGRRLITQIAAGTSDSMKKINKTGLGKIIVPIPTIQEQQNLIEKVDSLKSTYIIIKAHLEILLALKKNLLSVLIGGI